MCEDLQFSRREVVIGHMRRHSRGYIRRDHLFPCVHSPYRAQQVFSQRTLEQVGHRARLESPDRLHVTLIRRQDDEAGTRKRRSNFRDDFVP